METISVQDFKRLERKIDQLLSAKKKEEDHWIKVDRVQELTGWDKEKLRRMRAAGIIKMQRSEKFGIRYQRSSIPDEYIISNQFSQQ